MKISIVGIFCFLFLLSCHESKDRWDVSPKTFEQKITLTNVSKKYYNPQVNNAELRKDFPDFFSNIPDSILTKRRNDSLAIALNKSVTKEFAPLSLQDSLQAIFSYVSYYYPSFKSPKIFTFTGELPYMNPIVYFGQTNDMVMGLDWFLGSDYPAYEELGIPQYLRATMSSAYLKPVIAGSIATQLVPFDIRKRKFVEKMIYAGKILIAQQAFLPNVSAERIMGYTPEELQWCKDNEADIYVYFAENELFFSDKKTLSERFIDPAPFSKFYGENDTESPGRVGAWMGWQICQHYLDENPKVDLTSFLADSDYLKIFKDSNYKPTK